MRLIDAQYTQTPFYGWPKMTASLRQQGYAVNHKRVQRLMHLMGLQAIYPMDGRGRALDNVFVERLWRSLKYENIYIQDYRSVPELAAGVGAYFWFYNMER